MARSFEQVMKSLPAARREAVEARGEVLMNAHMTLQELRKALNLTQETLAEMLDMRQATVSKVEKRSDMLISTLRSYVEAMGGSLELVAHLPGRMPVSIDGVADLRVAQSNP